MLYRDRPRNDRAPRTTNPSAPKAEPVSDFTGAGLDGIPTLTDKLEPPSGVPKHDPYASGDQHFQDLNKRMMDMDSAYTRVLETMQVLEDKVPDDDERFALTCKIILAANPSADIRSAIEDHRRDFENYGAVIENIERQVLPVGKIENLRADIAGKESAVTQKKRQIQELTVSIGELDTEIRALYVELAQAESTMVRNFSLALQAHMNLLDVHEELLNKVTSSKN